MLIGGERAQLLVDDDPVLRSIVERILARGEIVVCERLRESAEGALIPMVMLSGLNDTIAIALPHRKGATNSITIPINLTPLADKVRCALRAKGRGVAREHGLHVVAEGMETKEPATFMLHRASNVHPGYLFSPPVPAAAFVQLQQTRALAPDLRTSISRRTRVLPWSVLVFALSVGTVSAVVEHVLEVRDAARLTANDAFYSLGGQRIRYYRTGPGAPGPTVVLLNGGMASLEQWHAVQTSLSAAMTVVSYDRSGTGFSDPPNAYDANANADELDQLLHSPGFSGPFVLVSYSSSAYIAMVFAARHPDAVQGMVFVDPALRSPAPGTKTYRRIFWRQIVATPLEAFFGYMRLKSAILAHDSPQNSPLADRSNAVLVSTHQWLATAHDVLSLDESADEADAAMASHPLTHFPVSVLTTVDPAESQDFRDTFEQQRKLATGSERGIVRLVHVEHSMLLKDPVAIGAIVDLIRTIVDAVHNPVVDAVHNTSVAGTESAEP